MKLRRSRLAEWSAFGLALLFGAFFRFVHLREQLPIHDEWHALSAVAKQSAGGILGGFRFSDYSIPIALYLEFLSHGPGLTELSHLLPFALIGLASCLILPLLVRADLGWQTAALYSWLLAASPLLVYYSRFARSYAIATPAAFVSILLFRIWWRDRRPGAGALYATLTALVAWTNLVHLPFCLAPFAVALAGRPDRGGLLRLSRLGVVTAIVSSALVLPALAGGVERVAAKAGAGHLEAGVIWPMANASLGMAGGAVAAGFLVLALAGAVGWPVQSRDLLAHVVAASALQAVAVALVAPKGVQEAFVLARYLLPVLLTALLLAATSLIALVNKPRSTARRRLVAMVIAVALGVATTRGPLFDLIRGPQNFGSSVIYYRFFYTEAWLSAQFRDPPYFYGHVLAAAPAGTVRIVEAPYSGRYAMPYARYQLLHRQRVGGGFLPAACSGPTTPELPTGGEAGFRFATLFSLDDVTRLRKEGIRFVILHRRPRDETPWRNEQQDLVDIELCTKILSERLGTPVFEDPRITVFGVRARDPALPSGDAAALDGKLSSHAH